MRIAIDFDDVVVHTCEEWCVLANEFQPPKMYHWTVKDMTSWGLAGITGLDEKTVVSLFEKVEYDEVVPVWGAVNHILEMVEEGHFVEIVTGNPRYIAIRNWMNKHELGGVPLSSVGNKIDFVKDFDFDVLVDDKPETLHAVSEAGIRAIRFSRSWNENMSTKGWELSSCQYSALNWHEVWMLIRNFARLEKQPALANYSKRNKLTNIASLDHIDCAVAPTQADLKPLLEILEAASQLAVPLPIEEEEYDYDNGQYEDDDDLLRRDDETPYVRASDTLTPDWYSPTSPPDFDSTDEDVIANEKGALQTDLKARFDLLPALAIARVAQVLHKGAEKYGKDNWRGLSVAECHNHTLGHAIGYNNSDDLEDLAHTACRALMTLELALAEWIEEMIDDSD